MVDWSDPAANPLSDLKKALQAMQAPNSDFNKKMLTLSEKLVALGQKGVPDPDWDPLEHPKDALGQFVKKGFGVYLFGKNKKAKFTEFHATTQTKPTVATDLLPGDKVWAVTTAAGSKYMMIEHHDGSATLAYNGMSPVSGLAKEAYDKGSKVLIKQVPFTEVKAATLEEAKAKINSVEGKVVYDLGSAKIVLEHNQKLYKVTLSGVRYLVTTDGLVDDMWTPSGHLLPDDVWDDKAWQKYIGDDKKSVLVADGAGSPSPHPDSVIGTPFVKATPGGSVFTHPVSGAQFHMNSKQALYQHKASPNSFIIYGGGQDEKAYFFDKNGKEKPASYQKHLKFLDKNYKKVFGKDQKLPEQGTEAHKKAEPVVEQPKFTMSKTPLVKAVTGANGSATFKHPVSGAVQDLTVEESLYQHIMSPNSFIIYSDQPGLTPQFFDKNGKQKNASFAKHLKFLGTNYKKIYGPAQNMPTEGGAYYGAPVPKVASEWHKATAKAKTKVEKPTLPKEWTDPKGTHHVLKPGEIVFQSPVDSNVFVLINNQNTGLKWEWDGGAPGPWVESQAAYKKAKWPVVAAFPLPKLGDFNATPDEFFESPQQAQKYVKGALDKLAAMVGMTSSYYGYYQASPDSWFNLPSGSGYFPLMEKLASHEFQTLVETTAATLENIKAFKGGEWDTYTKTQFGKTRGRFEVLAGVSRLAQLVTQPDSDPSEIDGLVALLHPKLSNYGKTFGNNFPIDGYTLDVAIQSTSASWKFKQSIKGLNFDPDTASLEVLAQYATEHGFPLASVLSKEDAQLWVKMDLGDPSVHGNNVALVEKNKATILDSAKIKLAGAKSLLFLKSLQGKPQPKEMVEAAQKAQEAKQKAVLEQAKSLFRSYAGPGGNTSLTYMGPDEWRYVPHGVQKDAQILTTYDAVKMLDTSWLPTTTVQVSGNQSYAEKLALFESSVGKIGALSDEQMNKTLKERGASYVSEMSTSSKLKWLKRSIADDQIGIYFIESTVIPFAHEKKATHPGSPESPQGKVARQMLADFLAGQDWWQQSSKDTNAFDGMDGSEVDKAWLLLHPEQFAPVNAGTNLAVLSLSQKRVALKRWMFSRWPLPNPSYDINAAFLVDPSFAPPHGVDAEAWTIVLAAEKGGKEATDLASGVDPAQFASNTLGSGTIPSTLIPFIPDELKKLAVWSKTSPYGPQGSQKQKIREAIKARIAQGGFVPASVPKWKDPSGKEWPLAPGSSVYSHPGAGSGYYYIINPDGQSGIQVTNNGGFGTLQSFNIEAAKAGPKVLTIPQTLTFEQAQKDGLDATLISWMGVEDAEKPGAKVNLPNTNYPPSVLLFAVKQDPKTPPTLKTNATQLPQPVLKVAVWALAQGETGVLNVIEHKLKSGHYSTLKNQLMLDPGKPYADKVMSGLTTEYDLANWPFDQLKPLADDLGVEVKTGNLADIKMLAQTIQEIFSGDGLSGESKTGIPDKLQLTKTGKKLGGMHSGFQWADQNGNAWMSKAFPSDPNGPSRVDQENAANRIGRLFGFHQPETLAMTLDGEYSYVQYMKPALSNEGLLGMEPSDLTDEQLAQAMEEHVLDWVISNHDTHQQNLLLDPNGKDVIGIDKGQAFKFFPDDMLKVGWVPAGNGEAVWYDRFYYGVRDGSISKERADKITRRVLMKAWRVQRRNDTEYRDLLEQALGKRKSWPGEYPTKEKYIDALMARKSHTLDDFVNFYKTDVYGKSKYSFDIDVEKLKLAKLGEHIHVAVSDEYVADVLKSGTHGQALMVTGPDLEDAHLLTYIEQLPDGKTLLRGDAKVRKDADKVLTKWLKAQTVTDETHGGEGMVSIEQVDIEAKPDVLPKNDEWFAALKSAAMTVNHHSPATGGDGEYNQASLSNMNNVKNAITKELAALTTWEVKNPGKPYKSALAELVTKEQQEAWKAAMAKYLDDINFVEKSKNDGVKVIPHLEKAVYTPSKGLDTSVFDPSLTPKKPDVAPTWVYSPGSGPSVIYTKKGSKWEYEIDGQKHLISQIAMDQEVNVNSDNFTYFDPNASPEQTEAEGQVKVGLKDVKVKYTKAHGSGGTYDSDKELLVYKGEKSVGYYGYQYDVEFGNTTISYRPWNAPEVTRAQQGQLQIKVKDWDGSPDQISDVLDVLKEMGLNLPEADENGLELFYWKHLYGVLQERKDRNSTKYKPVRTSYEQSLLEAGGAFSTTDQELEALRKAWATAFGSDVVKNADYLPHFSRMRLAAAKDGTTSGHPYWYRPDVTMSELHKLYGNKTLACSLGASSHSTAIGISGYLPTEERLRILGPTFYEAGGYSGKHTDQENGASNFVFTRQGYNGGWNEGRVFWHPKVALRTTNYSFDGDMWGNITNRPDTSPFGMSAIASYQTSGNETQIKYGLSYLDDVAAVVFKTEYNSPDEAARQAMIKRLHNVGIYEIGGLPLEEVFVTDGAAATAAIEKAWKLAIQEEKDNKK